jgi:hypothetical protein
MLPDALSIFHAPWVFLIRLKHGFLAYAPQPCALGMLGAGHNYFFHLFSGKILVFRSKLNWKLA